MPTFFVRAGIPTQTLNNTNAMFGIPDSEGSLSECRNATSEKSDTSACADVVTAREKLKITYLLLSFSKSGLNVPRYLNGLAEIVTSPLLFNYELVDLPARRGDGDDDRATQYCIDLPLQRENKAFYGFQITRNSRGRNVYWDSLQRVQAAEDPLGARKLGRT